MPPQEFPLPSARQPRKSAKNSRKLGDSPTAVISRRAADRVRAGHPWVYRSDIERMQSVADPTADSEHLMRVVDPRGQPLGTALYSASSQIALRLVSAVPIDSSGWIELFQKRLRAAIAFRQDILDLASQGTDSCRLVFSEADFLPGLIVDKYNDLAVVQLLTEGMNAPGVRTACIEIIKETIGLRAIFERSDPKILDIGIREPGIRELEEPGSVPSRVMYLRDSVSNAGSTETVFQLNGIRFHYGASVGQKTGAFLDQRENYAAAVRHCRGDALDVCTYHGGFALHLAQSCRRVTGVDASRPALEVAERNLVLNRETLGEIEIDWIEANAFDLLREWSVSRTQFDSIVLDPPAFAKSKRAAEGALRGYKELNLRAFRMLRPGGTLVTCSCSHHVGIEDFTAIVAAAASDAGRQVRVLERRGAPRDHPVLLGVPETEYLKCLICRVD